MELVPGSSVGVSSLGAHHTTGMLWGAGVTAGVLVGARVGLPILARPGAVVPTAQMSAEARRMVEESFSDVDPEKLWDVHTHIVGLGMGGTGCFASDDMQSHLKPIQRLQFDMYLAASGIKHRNKTDQEFVERLSSLVREANPRGRAMLMAFDVHIREDGTEDLARSPFHVPNDYIAQLCSANAQFEMIASVHPYRKDALKRLEKAHKQGAIAVKWLPNAMGIDPASPLCDDYYALMKQLGLVLITHTGIEQAVHAEDAQRLGNPLRLRRPLDAGVRVIAAHCASLGDAEDLDEPGRGRVPAVDLFLRLMAEKKYDGEFFGDLSAVTLQNREPGVLKTLIERSDLHHRFANGSDYPVVAVNPVISLTRLTMQDLLDDADVEPLREIFSGNPFLFDYVLKRRLRVKSPDGERRFLSSAFETRGIFSEA